MTLTPFVRPYEYSEDHGPDDLSDVDLDHPKFRAAFPDGRVPIRYVPSLGFRSADFVEWADETLARFEHARSFPVDELEDLRSDFHYHVERGSRDAAHWHAAKSMIVGMLQRGLTLRQIHRYVEAPLSDVVWLYTLGSHSYHYSLTEGFARACDLLVSTDWTQARIASETGISPKSVMRLASHVERKEHQ